MDEIDNTPYTPLLIERVVLAWVDLKVQIERSMAAPENSGKEYLDIAPLIQKVTWDWLTDDDTGNDAAALAKALAAQASEFYEQG